MPNGRLPEPPSVLLLHRAGEVARRAREALELWGFEAEAVDEPEGALRVLAEQGGEAVVIELDLPEVDALGVLGALRAHRATREMVVVALTERVDDDLLALVEGAGCDRVLPAPADPDELAHELQRLLARRVRLAA